MNIFSSKGRFPSRNTKTCCGLSLLLSHVTHSSTYAYTLWHDKRQGFKFHVSFLLQYFRNQSNSGRGGQTNQRERESPSDWKVRLSHRILWTLLWGGCTTEHMHAHTHQCTHTVFVYKCKNASLSLCTQWICKTLKFPQCSNKKQTTLKVEHMKYGRHSIKYRSTI